MQVTHHVNINVSDFNATPAAAAAATLCQKPSEWEQTEPAKQDHRAIMKCLRLRNKRLKWRRSDIDGGGITEERCSLKDYT